MKKSLSLFFSFSLLSFYAPLVRSDSKCPVSYCEPNGPQIRFPFYLDDINRHASCGYHRFRLSCDNRNQTILTLPNSGPFIVTRIDYAKQQVYINDPDQCLPNRIMKTINLTGTPFVPDYPTTFTFYNCSNSEMSLYLLYRAIPVLCLSRNNNYTIWAMDAYYKPSLCERAWNVPVPVQRSVYQTTWFDLSEDLLLTWREPSCKSCEAHGGTCGFKGYTKEIGCFDRKGLSRRAKYGISVGIGVPGLICLIGLLYYARNRLKAQNSHDQMAQELSSTIITPQSAHIITGLDGPTINTYPKTILGESGRLPKPNDGTCSICLAEYLPKETLRSIPECNHYFHATCIDEWLKLNATCPLCRNSPAESSAETPPSSLSSSSPS